MDFKERFRYLARVQADKLREAEEKRLNDKMDLEIIWSPFKTIIRQFASIVGWSLRDNYPDWWQLTPPGRGGKQMHVKFYRDSIYVEFGTYFSSTAGYTSHHVDLKAPSAEETLASILEKCLGVL